MHVRSRTFGGNTTRRATRQREFDAHSPMFKNRHFNEEKRSKLFQEMPYVWGRLPKFAIAWVCCMNFWAGYYIYQKQSLNMHLQDETRKAYRRTLPFVQAMEDVRFCAVQERNYMILKACCDQSETPDAWDLLRSRYNQEDTFLSYYRGTTMRNHYDGRFGTARMFNIKSNRRPEDERGLVGAQEVSTYG